MPPIFAELSPSNGGALLLAGTTMVEPWDFGEYFLSEEDLEILIWYIIDVIIDLRSSVSFSILSPDYCLLDSSVAWIMSNCSSELLSILFRQLGTLELEVRKTGSHKQGNSYDLVLYGAYEN